MNDYEIADTNAANIDGGWQPQGAAQPWGWRLDASIEMRRWRVVREWRVLLGFVLAPLVVAVCLDPLLSWFRPRGSNVAIGMFFVLTVGAAAVAAYLFSFAIGYPYIRRKHDEGPWSVWAVVKGALVAALGFSLVATLIRLVSGAFALAGAMVVTMVLAFVLAAACFYLIACAGDARGACDASETNHPQALWA